MIKDSLLDKLVGEISRYNDKAFLKAAMAVCALAAAADDEVNIAEHYSIDNLLARDPILRHLDTQKAIDTLYDFIYAVRTEGDSARRILHGKVQRMAGDYKKSRTLLRVAYLVIVADHKILESEREEFRRLARTLGLEPEEIWQELA